MKKLMLSIIAVTIVFVSVSGFTKNHENSIKTKTINTFEQKITTPIDVILNFDSVDDFNNFDVSQINVKESSCTVCVTISIAGSGGQICATASTCTEAIKMVKEGLKGLVK